MFVVVVVVVLVHGLSETGKVCYVAYFHVALFLFSPDIILSPLDCQEALGMENGTITDRQISASSHWTADYAAIQGRLHFKAIPRKAGSWSADKNDLHQWLQVDLGSQYTKVTRVATQGRNDAAQWVTKYKLQYSNDEVTFQYYREQGQNADKVN